MNHKQKIRQDILNKRRKLDESIVNYHSDLISRRVCQSTLFQHASTLFIYVNYQNEVKTTPIIREAFRLNKTVAIPKIINHSMEFYKINSLEEVARGTFNILEPTNGVLLDPACGSGGMFVQTGDFVNEAGLQANSSMTF